MKTRLLLTTAALAAMSSAALAKDIKVPRDARNLEAALAKAEPGDRILVKGRIRRQVDVMTPGVTIVGRPGATMTADLVVIAEGVTVEGIKFKDASLISWDDATTVRNNTFVRAAVDVHGDDAVATGNVFDGKSVVSQAVSVIGEGAIVSRNAIKRYDEAVRVEGGGALVSDNALSAIDGAGVRLTGDGATIEDNDLSDQVLDGFIVAGDDATILGNTADVIQSGIAVLGNGAVIGRNTVKGNADFSNAGVYVIGNSALVQDNDLQGLSGGVFVDGVLPTISDNTVLATGLIGGIVVVETMGATVEGNVVDSLVDAGILVQGSLSNVEGNDVSGTTLGNGLVVSGSMSTVTDNVVSISDAGPYVEGDGSDAIAIIGDFNEVTGNDVTGTLDGGTGVKVEGDVNVVSENTATELQDGFGVIISGDDNLGVDNDVEDVNGEGVVIDGTGNVVDGSDTSNISSCGFLILGPTFVENCTAVHCGMGMVNLGDGTQVVDSVLNQNAPYDLVDLGGVTNTQGSLLGGVYDDPNQFPGFTQMVYVPTGAPTVTMRPNDPWIGQIIDDFVFIDPCFGEFND